MRYYSVRLSDDFFAYQLFFGLCDSKFVRRKFGATGPIKQILALAQSFLRLISDKVSP
jgi:hypothetical protein